MLLIFIAVIVLSLILTVVFAKIASENDDVLYAVISVLSAVVLLSTLIAALVTGTEWNSSKYKKDIINREFGTNYTTEDVFYGGDIIDVIQEIKRTRIELNANITDSDSRNELIKKLRNDKTKD